MHEWLENIEWIVLLTCVKGIRIIGDADSWNTSMNRTVKEFWDFKDNDIEIYLPLVDWLKQGVWLVLHMDIYIYMYMYIHILIVLFDYIYIYIHTIILIHFIYIVSNVIYLYIHSRYIHEFVFMNSFMYKCICIVTEVWTLNKTSEKC